MGHDIYAYKVSENELEAYRERYELDDYDGDEWSRRYNQYCNMTQAAYFRRNAFDKANKVLYRVLGAEDLYAGCSGCGESREFSKQDIEGAYAALDYVLADIKLEVNEQAAMVRDLMKSVLADKNGLEITPFDEDDKEVDLAWEREFLGDILKWMNESGKDRITIHFG